MNMVRILTPLTAAGVFTALTLAPAGAESARPALGAYSVNLWSVAAAGPSDVWAVGQKYPAGGGSQATIPLIRHWDGTTWRTVPTGHQGGGALYSVAVVSTDNVWAVGEARSSGELSQVLTLHWDGSAWSQVTTPTFPGEHNILSRISFISATNGIASGYYDSGEDVTPIHLAWNGSKWTSASGPTTSMYALGALSPSDAWGVGITSDHDPYTAHWDGTSWTPTATPGAGNLTSVTAIDVDDVWAAGNTYFGVTHPLVEHWDGQRWTTVKVHFPRSVSLNAMAISGSASDDVWLGGYTQTDGFLEHWDGQRWSMVRSLPGSVGDLRDVVAISSTDAWAVGFGKVLLHWNGKRWSQYHRPST